LKVVPIGADAGKQGSFVMILSTNADSVSNTIGKFAESDIIVSSLMYVATREQRKEAAILAETNPITSSDRNAAMSTIESLAKVPVTVDGDGDGANGGDLKKKREQKWLTVLEALATEIAPGARPSFDTIEKAMAWFDAQPAELAK
jgi:hypothetical protein